MKRVICVLTVFVLMLFAAGCGAKGIEGTWVLTEEYREDGTKVSGDELKSVGVAETYEIKDGKVKYTLELESAKKPIVIEYVLEDLGNNRYNFNLPKGSYTFAAVEVDGDTMSYDVSDGNSSTKMVFKRK